MLFDIHFNYLQFSTLHFLKYIKKKQKQKNKKE